MDAISSSAFLIASVPRAFCDRTNTSSFSYSVLPSHRKQFIMTDQNNRGFRKFMLDPKNSVMTYIADNIPPEHLSQQHQQGSSGRLQHGPTNGQQQQQQDPSRPQQNQPLSQPPQNQSHQDGFMRPPLPTRPSQSNSPSSSPRPGYAQPVRSSQMSLNTPYVASKVSQANQGLNGYAGAQSQGPGSQSMSNSSLAQESVSQQGPQSQYSSVQNGGPSAAVVGQGPPQPGARRRNSPQSAPRLYHRMMLEFEITKKTFFLAKSRKSQFHYPIWCHSLTSIQSTIPMKWPRQPTSLNPARGGYGGCDTSIPGNLKATPKRAIKPCSQNGKRNTRCGRTLSLTSRTARSLLMLRTLPSMDTHQCIEMQKTGTHDRGTIGRGFRS